MFRITLVAAMLLGLPAHAFVASNRLPVQATGPDSFEVQHRGSARGDIDYWCAAGEYAKSQLRAAGTARIYRISPPPRRSGQGITFSMNPAGAADRTGLATIGGSGDGSMSVAAARNQCEVSRQLSANRR
jgi:hypothetical protein